MVIYLVRHGRTVDNDHRRYQGKRNTPLSPAGEAELVAAEFTPEVVYLSPMDRVRRTAELVFPGARQVAVSDLREMDFGVFEGRSADDMERDPVYRAWVDGGCEAPCPGGESRGEFSDRVCAAFAPLVDKALAAGEERLVVVSHGGTQMSLLERYATPRRAYYDWFSPNGGGFLLETDPARWRTRHQLRLLKEISYAREGNGC